MNLNGYLASVARLSNGFKLGASLLTVVVAAVLGVGITLLREDAIYAAVVAWALWAVGSPAGWDELRVRFFSRDDFFHRDRCWFSTKTYATAI